MKILAVILSFLIFSQSIMPCSDAHTCEEENTTWTSQHDHSHSEDPADHCTPFCVCNCCGISIFSESLLEQTQNEIPPYSSYEFHYSFLYTFSFYHNIWHPPSFC